MWHCYLCYSYCEVLCLQWCKPRALDFPQWIPSYKPHCFMCHFKCFKIALKEVKETNSYQLSLLIFLCRLVLKIRGKEMGDRQWKWVHVEKIRNYLWKLSCDVLPIKLFSVFLMIQSCIKIFKGECQSLFWKQNAISRGEQMENVNTGASMLKVCIGPGW